MIIVNYLDSREPTLAGQRRRHHHGDQEFGVH